MFAPVLSGLSTHGLRKATGREKPPQYDLAWAQYSVARNAESLGIDPASIVGYWPMWEGAGGIAWDVSNRSNNSTLNLTDASWKNNYLNCHTSNVQQGDCGICLQDIFDNDSNWSIFCRILFTNLADDRKFLGYEELSASAVQWWHLEYNDYYSTLNGQFDDDATKARIDYASDFSALNPSTYVWYNIWAYYVDGTGYTMYADDHYLGTYNIDHGSMAAPYNRLWIGSNGRDGGQIGYIDFVNVFQFAPNRRLREFLHTHPYYLLQPVPTVRFFDMEAETGPITENIAGNLNASGSLSRKLSLTRTLTGSI